MENLREIFDRFKSLNIGICLNGPGMGDNLIMSSLSENFYKNTGKKMFGVSSGGILDHNPFIERNGRPDRWFYSTEIADGASKITRVDNGEMRVFSIADRLRYFFGLPKCYLRHPRLYIFEDSITHKDKVCVHTTGKSIGGELSDSVIEQIKSNYKDYRIVQVGGINDKVFPDAEKKVGMDLFQTAKEISESAIFIGVDSSQLHIANCYPKVRKKVVLNYLSEKEFEFYTPLYTHASWWEFNIETYCNLKYDAGVAMSFLKI